MNTHQRQLAWWLYGGLMLIFVALLWWVAATDQAMSGSTEALVTAPVATTESLSELPEGTSRPFRLRERLHRGSRLSLRYALMPPQT